MWKLSRLSVLPSEPKQIQYLHAEIVGPRIYNFDKKRQKNRVNWEWLHRQSFSGWKVNRAVFFLQRGITLESTFLVVRVCCNQLWVKFCNEVAVACVYFVRFRPLVKGVCRSAERHNKRAWVRMRMHLPMPPMPPMPGPGRTGLNQAGPSWRLQTPRRRAVS